MEEKRRSIDRDIGRIEGKIDYLVDMAKAGLEKDREQDERIAATEKKVWTATGILSAIMVGMEGFPVIGDYLKTMKIG